MDPTPNSASVLLDRHEGMVRSVADWQAHAPGKGKATLQPQLMVAVWECQPALPGLLSVPRELGIRILL